MEISVRLWCMADLNDLELVALEEDSSMPSDKPLFESRDLGSTDPGNSELFDLTETGETDQWSSQSVLPPKVPCRIRVVAKLGRPRSKLS